MYVYSMVKIIKALILKHVVTLWLHSSHFALTSRLILSYLDLTQGELRVLKCVLTLNSTYCCKVTNTSHVTLLDERRTEGIQEEVAHTKEEGWDINCFIHQLSSSTARLHCLHDKVFCWHSVTLHWKPSADEEPTAKPEQSIMQEWASWTAQAMVNVSQEGNMLIWIGCMTQSDLPCDLDLNKTTY